MRARGPRLAACLVAVTLGAGLVAGCGGDDEEPAGATTVTERVTVTTDQAPPATVTDVIPDGVPEDVPTGTVPEVIPDGAPDAGDGGAAGTRPTDAEIDDAVRAYATLFGITEEQARCIVEGSIELTDGADPGDPSALLASGGLELLRGCGLDPAQLAEQFGGVTP